MLRLRIFRTGSAMDILVFFAHPDDETMFLGGTLTALATQGAKVAYLCATRGEGGERGDPPVCAQEELGEVRAAELACAVRVLGGQSLQFLDYSDPPIGPAGELYPYAELNDTLIGKIRLHLTRLQPEVIITHGPEGEYGHPGHVLTHQALMEAVFQMEGLNPAVYAPSWLSREDQKFTPPPDYFLDVSAYLDQKIAAACCHRSQHSLFMRHGAARAGKPVTVPELIRGREGLVQLHPGKGQRVDHPLAAMLEPLIF